ncbi:lysozyme c-1-like [Mercenaria mercenaria]|uniref:lysozyme c-1-like n=1 Tax=Mercenaria mercenaria TaxID=6596 RepID=UPI001E1D9275|nr:lysozyme c-1-like [Mercenaria mercenaria]
MNALQTKTLFIVLMMIERCIAGTKTKCQVVAALRAQGVPDSDLRDWLCLVAHESSYKYDAENNNSNGSTDYGIFQFNNNYNCGNSDGTNSATCWRLRTYGCADSCSSFTDSDITNDANCAKRIKDCDGFTPWYGWRNHCSDVSGSAYDYSGC